MNIVFLIDEFFIGAGGHFHESEKVFIKTLLIVIAHLRRYLRDGNIRLFQKHFRLEDFIVIEIFVYGHRIFVRKKFVEIILRNARLFGYFFHADGVL